MSHSIETKIQVAVLMRKFESPAIAIRELQRQAVLHIPVRQTITSIYQKFLETDSVQDLSRVGKPSTITEDEIKEILEMESTNSIRNVTRHVNI